MNLNPLTSGHVMVRKYPYFVDDVMVGRFLLMSYWSKIRQQSPLKSVVGESGLDLDGQAVNVLFLCVT